MVPRACSRITRDPAGASAYLLFADTQRNEKKFAEANATLQTFLEKNPKHELAGTARLAIAGNLEALGKKDEALATYQRLVSSDPKGFAAPVFIRPRCFAYEHQLGVRIADAENSLGACAREMRAFGTNRYARADVLQ